MNERAPEEERLDALRRRLYAPGATDEDLVAYRTASEDGEEPEQLVADVGVPVVRRPRAVIVGVVAVLVALGVVAVVQLQPAVRVRTPTPSPTATLAEGRMPTSAAVRAAFVNALGAGRPPGLLDYFSEHPDYRPPTLRTTGRAASDEYSGQATQTIMLDPSALAEHGGRVTVIVLLDSDASFSWRAERVDQADDRSGPVVPVASHAGTARAGEPTSATVAYTGEAPTRLAVFVNEPVRWDVAVVFTD